MLQLNSISRSFGDTRVLDDVAFTVEPGRMTGFVGANGAGKTTTMRIILGVLQPDSGTVTWKGEPIGARTRHRFGYMPEERGLYPKMRVAEQITYLARLHGHSAPAAAKKTTDLLDRLGLVERAEDDLETLSLGNQQRAQVAAALVHDPEVLILDEPFSGLDPIAVETMLSVLQERAISGAAVLFSSHQLDLVERLCDDVVIIADGAIAVSGSREVLQEKYAARRFELLVDEDAGWVRDEPGVRVLELDGPRAVVELSGEASGDDQDQTLLRTALARGPVRGFQPVIPSLSEIFAEVLPQ